MKIPQVDESLVKEIEAVYGIPFAPNRNFQESTIAAFDQKHGMVFCLTDDGKVITKPADLFLELYRDHLAYVKIITDNNGDAFFRRNGVVGKTCSFDRSICENGKIFRGWSDSPVVARYDESTTYLLSKSHGVFFGWNYLLGGQYIYFSLNTIETRDGLPETVFNIEVKNHDVRMRDLKIDPEKPTGYESVDGMDGVDINTFSPMNKLEFLTMVNSKLSDMVSTIISVYTDQERPIKCDLDKNIFLLVRGDYQWHLQFTAEHNRDEYPEINIRLGRVSGSKYSMHYKKQSFKEKTMKDVVSANEFPELLRKVIDNKVNVLIKKVVKELYG